MKCALCGREILDYNPKFNQLKINENIEHAVCQECVDKFLRWQQSIYADLFPTKTAKKMFGKK